MKKRVVVKTHRSLLRGAALTTVFALGGLVGAVMEDGGATGVSAMGVHPCEQDECERGSWWPWDNDECVDNGGEDTYCDMVASGCKSRACGHN